MLLRNGGGEGLLVETFNSEHVKPEEPFHIKCEKAETKM